MGGEVRPRVEVGVGVRVGVEEVGTTAAGVGDRVVTTSAARFLPLPAGMFGAEALGSNRPTPGTDSGSRPGDAVMLMTNSTR